MKETLKARVARLEEALKLAVKDGVLTAYSYPGDPLRFRDAGCDCCSSEWKAPEHLRDLFEEAAQ